MLELIGRLEPELGAELAQLLDALGLQVCQVHAGVVRIALGRERTGVDGGVAPSGVVVATTLEDGARRLAPRAPSTVRSPPRATAALGSDFVVHEGV